ncbi:putative multi antimicrobial extrusion protein [Helianthus annuus]|nr:putative multi antimicrobial extrusion protein [Helianthus annuus]KAJ0461561.1 putative multi antimicrobial extrusion protein [Helianthus annuus]KAJ0641988.1 putative multi antimicrobial extrusion protein [Helianthus annuus]KAJ0645859.1 putative multi antimicrobial extrusion protein [Helianthus annuus]
MDDGIDTKLLRHEEEEEGDLKQRIWVESKKIWRVALPGVISRVCAFGTIVVTQSFIGHISDIDLAGYALVQTLSVRFVNGILLGMSSATETLCGQAFGAGQHHMMGIYLQRSWIVDLITLTVLLPVFIFGTQIYKLVGEEEAIANSGGYISLWFIPFVYNFVFSLTIQMYLQAQLKNMVIAWLSVFQFGIHIPLSLLFVYKLNMGIAGAMIALSMSSWFLVIGEFIYIFGGWCPNSWKGFTVAAFKDLVPVVKLSLSSGVMVCLELWYNAVLVLLAGYMQDAEVAISAFSICLNVNAWEFMISLGFLGAACVRVANELGRGNAKAVRFSIQVLLGTSIAIGVFFFVLCLAFGKKLAYMFTDDERVADTVSDLSLLLSFSVLLNSIYPVLSGVAVGAGLQSAVAIVNLVCFYLIGIPLGALLGYLTSLEVKGIWIGMIGGVLTQTITLVYMTWRTDWDDQVTSQKNELYFYIWARLSHMYMDCSSSRAGQKGFRTPHAILLKLGRASF